MSESTTTNLMSTVEAAIFDVIGSKITDSEKARISLILSSVGQLETVLEGFLPNIDWSDIRSGLNQLVAGANQLYDGIDKSIKSTSSPTTAA